MSKGSAGFRFLRWLPMGLLFALGVGVGCSPAPERKLDPNEAKRQLQNLEKDLKKEQGEQ